MWNLWRKKCPRQAVSLPSTLHPRRLHPSEADVAKEASHNDWDGGAVKTALSTLYAHAYDGNGYTILIWGDAPKTVPEQAIQMLTWLGAPKGFQVYLFWRDDPRDAEADEPLSPENVNGGFAVPGISKVYVYRSEEWDRVMLHECIHALGWDWANFPIQPCWNLPSSSKLMPTLFEAWTELFAEWLWCLWYAPPEDTKGDTWKQQRSWQDQQAIHVLARYKGVWNETTNVFAYYVLKAALAPHMDLLLLLGNEVNQLEICELAGKGIQQLRDRAKHVKPSALTLRMTNPSIHK